MIVKPEVGMGGTISLHNGSIWLPCTVISHSPSGKSVEVQMDSRILSADGYSTHFERNPSGRVRKFTYRSDGLFREAKSDRNYGSILGLGERQYYWDPTL